MLDEEIEASAKTTRLNSVQNGSPDGNAVKTFDSTLSIADSSFVGNTATRVAGAIASSGPASPSSIVNCHFERNTANMQGDWWTRMQRRRRDPFEMETSHYQKAAGRPSYGAGAIFIQDVESFRIANCNFSQNSAYQGGAVFFDGQVADTDLSLSGCLFRANQGNASGGAIHVNVGVTLILEQNDFINNSANMGGAIYMAGSSNLSTPLQSQAELNFQNNSAIRGGAINCFSCGKCLCIGIDLTSCCY